MENIQEKRLFAGVFLLVAIPSLLAGDSLRDGALNSYRKTDYGAAISALNALPRKTAPDWLLLGKAYFMNGDYQNASQALEQSVAGDPNCSECYLWLGKAQGRRAESGSPFAAPGLAVKSRRSFERAVEINPSSKEALNDLFEYYLQAPGFLGGGEEKARALLPGIAALDKAEGYFAEARFAENRKDWTTAETKYRRAVEVSPREAGRWVDLAKFLARRGRIAEAEEILRRAENAHPDAPSILFARGEIYVEAKRSIEEARRLLRRYLAASLTPDDPPRADAEKLLKRVEGQ